MADYSMRFPPKLEEIFTALFSGYHLTIEDGESFLDLSRHDEWYRSLFAQLGMELSDGSDGIYYFVPDTDVFKDLPRRMTAFVAILCDWLGDSGKDPYTSIMEDEFVLATLPHITKPEYIDAMAALKVNTGDDIDNILNALKRAGFISMDDGVIRFKKATRRILSAISGASEAKEKSHE